MHLGWAVEAGAALKAAIDIDGGYSDAHCRLGTVYLRLGHRDEAKQAYLTALSLAPGDSDILANLRAVDHGR
jgi:Tfp pilus assembly protein PilF